MMISVSKLRKISAARISQINHERRYLRSLAFSVGISLLFFLPKMIVGLWMVFCAEECTNYVPSGNENQELFFANY
ncbi:Oidioi.mRNA.OKI2018_I69.chr1.g2812.t1.cds [Oikopleura dioica]|uniref:Oidioi.mRNA.OKI2018_I69.chr1.g2812.t1.cds n=1 Tax=Oikopleura dioica TaxID=34765 RepID=A0ABN7SSV2_OIKDI|nr:Oidioi.mRNA.OKI2018_I69.chr1.g2812.t1.cds [Oikopleura dioica]